MGLDHGTWTILKYIYPNADIPVYQLSIDYSKSELFHFELAQQLQLLRKKGVLIIGSDSYTNLNTSMSSAQLNSISGISSPSRSTRTA